VRSMSFQSTSKFLPSSRLVLVSLLFIDDKFGDLSLQEPEKPEVIRSGINHVPPVPIRVGLVNEPQLGHRFKESGEAESDPPGVA
jgi:hypothetical protein